MTSTTSTSSMQDQVSLDRLRGQRAELRESMSALELALAGPATSGEQRWAERVHVALVELAGDFRAHVEFTEGPDGLYADILAAAPRLAGAVDHLTEEHLRIDDALADALDRAAHAATGDVDRVRALGTTLLGLLMGHRQRGSDLVYEAYEVDVGGET